MEPPRVTVTDEAAALIRQLCERHGRLIFHQSGGCCDGSAPMCFPLSEFRIGQNDVYLGHIEGCPVYIGGRQFEAWQGTQLQIDVVPGRGAGFSLEAPEGFRFITRSRVFSPDELERLSPPRRGASE